MYSDTHPDVIRARERLEAAKQAATSAGPSGGSSLVSEQIAANNDAIGQLSAARDAAMARANSMMAGQARAPAIEEQAMQLESRASALRDQLKSVSEDLLKARANVRMSNEQRGERLSLVDPPNLPDHPSSPNRPLLIAGGCAAGLALGIVLALLVEFLRRPIRSPLQIQALGIPILGVVPILEPKNRPRKKRWFHKAKAHG
jgi:protein tyrosine kinase modulator